ncbi:hypothetical protein [Brucella sp. 10RB9214]|uniref:hypothetical protein n=1 Tax=unclassified Brucella TaxID=2632610 RepID=UPI0031B8585A
MYRVTVSSAFPAGNAFLLRGMPPGNCFHLVNSVKKPPRGSCSGSLAAGVYGNIGEAKIPYLVIRMSANTKSCVNALSAC